MKYILLFALLSDLVGLKYAVEVGKSVDDPNPVYYCSICNEYFNSSVKLRHFTSTEHIKTVLVRARTTVQATYAYHSIYMHKAIVLIR